MPRNRVSRSVVWLAASAITAVYAAGYIHTQAADASLGTPDAGAPSVASAPATAQPPAVTTTNPLPPSTARQGSSSTKVGSGTVTSTQAGTTLKDGSYTG